MRGKPKKAIPTAKQVKEVVEEVKKQLRENPRTEELPGLSEEARKFKVDY